MNDDTIPQTVLFPDLFTQPLIATFDQPHARSAWDASSCYPKSADSIIATNAAPREG